MATGSADEPRAPLALRCLSIPWIILWTMALPPIGAVIIWSSYQMRDGARSRGWGRKGANEMFAYSPHTWLHLGFLIWPVAAILYYYKKGSEMDPHEDGNALQNFANGMRLKAAEMRGQPIPPRAGTPSLSSASARSSTPQAQSPLTGGLPGPLKRVLALNGVLLVATTITGIIMVPFAGIGILGAVAVMPFFFLALTVYGAIATRCPNCGSLFTSETTDSSVVSRDQNFKTVTRRDVARNKHGEHLFEIERKEQVRVTNTTTRKEMRCGRCQHDWVRFEHDEEQG